MYRSIACLPPLVSLNSTATKQPSPPLAEVESLRANFHPSASSARPLPLLSPRSFSRPLSSPSSPYSLALGASHFANFIWAFAPSAAQPSGSPPLFSSSSSSAAPPAMPDHRLASRWASCGDRERGRVPWLALPFPHPSAVLFASSQHSLLLPLLLFLCCMLQCCLSAKCEHPPLLYWQ